MLIKYTIILYCLLCFCSCHTNKQNLKSAALSADPFQQKVDALIINKMNQYSIPGLAIGLVAGDSVLYQKGYGIKEIRQAEPITEHSIFHTASVSKLFTAQAIMKLVDEGKLSVEDKLIHIIPDLQYSDPRIKLITIKSLLNHTSGLPDVSNYHWKNNHQEENSLSEYILGQRIKLSFPPLSTFHYSNLGYNILGYVIETITNTSFEDYVNDNILDLYDMRNSDFRYYQINDALKVSPHSRNRFTKKIYKRKTYPYTREHAASSTLNASVADLCNWMSSFLKLIHNKNPKNIYLKMIELSTSDHPYMGLGFQLRKLENKLTIGHYGGDKGFRSYLIMVPDEKIGLVLLANCDYEEQFRSEILHSIAKMLIN